MTDLEIKQTLVDLKEKYKIDKIEITYYGSGDSFENYDIEADVHIDDSDIEDLFWELVERAGSDFNNDGSEGTVTLNLAEGKASIKDYYVFMEKGLRSDITI